MLRWLLSGVGAFSLVLGCDERPPLPLSGTDGEMGRTGEPGDPGGGPTAPVPERPSHGKDAVVVETAPLVIAEAPDQGYLLDLFVDESGVYFAGGRAEIAPLTGWQTEFGVVRHVAKAGGPVRELWSGAGMGLNVFASERDLYLLAYAYTQRDGRLLKLPKTGGPVTELGAWSSHGTSTALAGDREHLYWAYSTGSSGHVKRTSILDDATVELRHAEVAAAITMLPIGGAVWSAGYELLTDWSWPSAGVSVLWRPAAADARIEAVASSPVRAEVYAAAGTGELVRLSMDGVGPVGLPAVGGSVGDMVADNEFLYVGVKTSGQIVKVPIAGGPTKVLASGSEPRTLMALAIDQGFVYWVDGASRKVFRVAKGS